VYEEALRPLGLRSTQFTLLQVLALAGERPQRELAEMLALDSTSLTRMIATMKRQGWIKDRRGEDRRERWLSLTKVGEARLRLALPAWDKVQARLRDRMGDRAWSKFVSAANELTNTVRDQGGSL
jgi:DNA-binding MarR family transcriptional regulator